MTQDKPREKRGDNMEFEKFLNELDRKGWGVAIFNTYHLDGVNHFFLMVAFKGGNGQFMKKEGKIEQLQNAFVDIVGEFD